ncbi:hypothetical protein [Roseivirga echinicomitans]|uniref:Uncharacterized protein n=1 Tax=Roseivirga echinicomitans TaxID=296218 RepID=A0A150XXA3_9BACT|nr:hypothetical protein [Roseivirga echinicomitans]KYG83326.1 hypothetical protein AWN68_00510 [Roseivirga echinicomitans]
MSWLKSKYTLMLLGLLLATNNLIAQDDFDDKNLFYCNESVDIEFIWPLSEDYFVANVKDRSKSGPSSELLLLLNKSHLIVDTVYVLGGFLNSLNVRENNSFTLVASFATATYKVANDQFTLVSNTTNIEAFNDLVATSNFNQNRLGYFYGLEVGYETKAKDRTKKREKKNIPRYYYLDEDGEKRWINSGKEEVVGDQWKSFLDQPTFALGEVTSYKGEIYFNIPMIGTCYILNPQAGKVRTVLYPTEGANSWFLTVDKVTGTTYLVGDMGDDQFSIYHIDLKTNKKALVSTQQGFYDAIVNDQILVKKEIALDRKKKFNCFYLVPVFSK